MKYAEQALREKLAGLLEMAEQNLRQLDDQRAGYWQQVMRWADSDDITYGMSVYGAQIAETEGAIQVWRAVLNRVRGHEGLELVARWMETRQLLEDEQMTASCSDELDRAKKSGRAKAARSVLQWMDRIDG